MRKIGRINATIALVQYSIRNEPERQRFVLLTNGHEAVLRYQRNAPDERYPAGTLDINHVGVPRPLEGRGIGSALVQHVLDWAASEGLRVRPYCSFADAHIARDRERQPLLVEGWK